MKRLTIIGLPSDLLTLIRVWLTDRAYYVTVKGKKSMFINLTHSKIQGSILGPFLYSIYVSQLFHIANLTNLAGDNCALSWSNNINDLIRNME